MPTPERGSCHASARLGREPKAEMDTRVEQACILLGALGVLSAMDGVPRFVGLERRGFLYLYRDPRADRWSRLIPVATVYVGCSLVALVCLLIAEALWPVEALLGGLAVVFALSTAAAALALAKGPWYLLPPWAARLVRRGWNGYWGDDADRVQLSSGRWQSILSWAVGGGGVIAWVVVSPGFEKIWPLGFGFAAALATLRSQPEGGAR
jgi:hypothetical protein